MKNPYNDLDLMQKINWLVQNADSMKRGPQGIDGPLGPEGPQGPSGRDGSPDKPEDILKKINSVKGGIKVESIEGMPTAEDWVSQYKNLPDDKRLSWNDLFPGKENLFKYYQVGGAGGGSSNSVGAASVQTIAASGAITEWTSIVEATAATDIVLTVPTLDTGKFIYLKKVDAGTGTVTVSLTQETVILSQQDDAVIIANDGTNTYIVSEYKVSSPFLNITAAGTTALTGNAESVTVDATAGNIILTLPTVAAANDKNVVTITRTDSTTNTVTITGGQIDRQLVAAGDAIMFRSDNTTTSAWVVLSDHAIGALPTWTASTAYEIGNVVEYLGVRYYREVAGTSAATFTPAEQANWLVLGPLTRTTEETASAKTSSFTVLDNDGVTTITPGSATVVTLPVALSQDREFHFTGEISAVAANTVTLTPGGGAVIVDPITFFTVPSYQIPGVPGQHYYVKLRRVGNVWKVV